MLFFLQWCAVLCSKPPPGPCQADGKRVLWHLVCVFHREWASHWLVCIPQWSSYSHSEHATPPDGALIIYPICHARRRAYNVKSPSDLLSRVLYSSAIHILLVFPPGLTNGLSAFFNWHAIVLFIKDHSQYSSNILGIQRQYIFSSSSYLPSLITNFTNLWTLHL